MHFTLGLGWVKYVSVSQRDKAMRSIHGFHIDWPAGSRGRRRNGRLTGGARLADYFEHVVVLERDALLADASPRIGTLQSRHTHALLGGGQRALSELFPGFEHDLARTAEASPA